MRRLYRFAIAMLLLPGTAAFADTISASAVPVTYAGNSSESVSFNALGATTVANGGTFTQTGKFIIDYSSDGTRYFDLSDTFTINGITQTLVLNAADYITNAYDRLVIDAVNGIAFGDTLVSFAPVTATGSSAGSFAINLTGTVTDHFVPATAATSEPSSLLLLLSGFLTVAALLVRRSATSSSQSS